MRSRHQVLLADSEVLNLLHRKKFEAMIVAEDEENDEKAQALRRKIIKNVVEAKLKNEREKERLGRRLGNLAKEEQREMKNIQRNLVSLRRELKAIDPGKNTTETRLSVKTAVQTHVADKGDMLANATKRDYKLYQRRHSEDAASRSPMSFLELKRLPPLESTDQGLVVWPLPYRQERSKEFPPPLKHRKSLALPKIERPDCNEKIARRARFQSSPAVLSNVAQSELARINRDDPLKQESDVIPEDDGE